MFQPFMSKKLCGAAMGPIVNDFRELAHSGPPEIFVQGATFVFQPRIAEKPCWADVAPTKGDIRRLTHQIQPRDC